MSNKKLIIGLVLVFLLVTGCIDLGERRSIDYWNDRGIELLDQGKYEEALEAFDRALKIDSNDADVLNNKGFVLEKLGRYKEALELFNKALEIDPKDTSALINKGNTLADLGEYDAAIEVYDRLLKNNPENAELWNNKGLILQDIGRYKEAISHYSRALEINSKNERIWNNRATLIMKLDVGGDNWTKYKNYMYSYSFECPITWFMAFPKTEKVTEEQPEFVIAFIELKNNATTGQAILSEVSVYQKHIDFEIDKEYENKLNSNKLKHGKIEMIKTEINSNEVWIFQYDYETKGNKHRVKEAMIKCSSKKIISVGGDAILENFPLYEPIFDRVINSTRC